MCPQFLCMRIHVERERERERERGGGRGGVEGERGVFVFRLSLSFSMFHAAGKGGGGGGRACGRGYSWPSKEASCLTPAERWTISWPMEARSQAGVSIYPLPVYLGRYKVAVKR